MKNKSEHEHAISAITLLNANIEHQTPELKKSLILETIKENSYLLGQSYMVN